MVEELCNISRTSPNNVCREAGQRVVKLLLEIKASELSPKACGILKSANLWPCKTSKDAPLTLVSYRDTFFIPDNEHFVEVIGNRIPVLELRHREVKKLGPLFDTLKFKSRYMSKCVTVTKSAADESNEAVSLSTDLRKREAAFYSCSIHFKELRPKDDWLDLLRRRLRGLRVFRASDIHKTYIVDSHGVMLSEKREGLLSWKVYEDDLKIFVHPEPAKQKYAFATELVRAMISILDIPDDKSWPVICAILAADTSSLFSILQWHGIVDEYADEDIIEAETVENNESGTETEAYDTAASDNDSVREEQILSTNRYTGPERRVGCPPRKPVPGTLPSKSHKVVITAARATDDERSPVNREFTSHKSLTPRAIRNPLGMASPPASRPTSRESPAIPPSKAGPVASQTGPEFIDLTQSDTSESESADDEVEPTSGLPTTKQMRKRHPHLDERITTVIDQAKSSPRSAMTMAGQGSPRGISASVNQGRTSSNSILDNHIRVFGCDDEDPHRFDMASLTATLPRLLATPDRSRNMEISTPTRPSTSQTPTPRRPPLAPPSNPSSTSKPQSGRNSEHNHVDNFAIGFQGELFVVNYFKRFIPDFNELDNWTSKLRQYAGFEEYKRRERTDLWYDDQEGYMSRLLLELYEGMEAPRWLTRAVRRKRGPQFCVEVKCTARDCGAAFYVSEAQYHLMETMTFDWDDEAVPAEVYLLVRVYEIEGTPKIKAFLDPRASCWNGQLDFRATAWTVKAT